MEKEGEDNPYWWCAGIWISVRSAANLLGVSEAAIRERCGEDSKEPLVWRLNPKKSKEIHLLSLGEKAIKKFTVDCPPDEKPPRGEDIEEFIKLFHSSPGYLKKYSLFWTEVLLESKHCRGTNQLKRFVATWNSAHAEKEQISLPRLYAIRKLYKDNGYDRSFLLKERRTPPSTVKDKWFEDFKNAYDSQTKKSAKKARIEALNSAKKRNEKVDANTFPSVASFRRKSIERKYQTLLEKIKGLKNA